MATVMNKKGTPITPEEFECKCNKVAPRTKQWDGALRLVEIVRHHVPGEKGVKHFERAGFMSLVGTGELWWVDYTDPKYSKFVELLKQRDRALGVQES